MTDLTDAELAQLEAADWSLGDDWDQMVPRLIAEVRRWRDQAADEAGLARLAAEIERVRNISVGSPGGATAAKGGEDE